MTRKERKLRAELEIVRIAGELAEIFRSSIYSDLPLPETVDELIKYADSLIRERPQEATLVRRACARFVETLERVERGRELTR